ncbi:beta-glucosidase family protein [Saccharothrix deserti]|uniref:beta-glucosidase family protein n=1 Tax=Saccharothrix deserti TaxID=2593674 RepID=UPI00131CBB35|nr:glycoside hydrolase family 3 N-terminal domain-containing protein [Saccharothrix deserti]
MTSVTDRSPDDTDAPGDTPWRDQGLPLHDRVEALLHAMTLEEKVAQLGSVWIDTTSADSGGSDGGGSAAQSAPLPDVFTVSTTADLDEQLRGGVGHLTRVFGTAPISVAEGVERLRSWQQRVVEGNRLGIPAIAHEECLTGFATFGATAYPTPLAWAATFDVDLVREMAGAIGRDLRAVGVHQGLSPVLDVVRDYRWGRVEETLGEDPYLVGQLGAAYVRGLESAGIIATLKHFAGYAASRAARNHAPVSIGPREMADVILPPFETALRKGGARSVMNSYTDVDGVPVAASAALLRELLRDHWGFTGTVVSDYWSVPFLASMHRIADDEGTAGAIAIRAGIDVELPETRGYGGRLVEHVRSGAVDEAVVDDSVRRVLRQKIELGLLDGDPLVPDSASDVDLDNADNRRLARAVAERSVVLLANPDGVLPLGQAGVGRLAVIGPCADDARTLLGCYAFPNHVLHRFPDSGMGLPIATIRQEIEAEFTGTDVRYAPGAEVSGDDDSGIAEAARIAAESDFALLFVGDRAGLFGEGTSGEGCDAADLRLPGVQGQLVDAVLATGTPTVLVVVSGRPYALGEYADRAAAVVQAFFPGVEGATAVAGVLSGRVNPSGRLPVQVPRSRSINPSTYLQPPLGAKTDGISALDPTALYPFGHGLSYSAVRYESLSADVEESTVDGSVEVRVTVRNTGSRTVDEVVQLYASDPVASVVRPVTQLVGFARVGLAPWEARVVAFDVPADVLSFTGVDGHRVVEPGLITFATGASVGALSLRTDVRLTGAPLVLAGARRLTSTHVVHDLGQ